MKALVLLVLLAGAGCASVEPLPRDPLSDTLKLACIAPAVDPISLAVTTGLCGAGIAYDTVRRCTR
jgi:hypothetical protein